MSENLEKLFNKEGAAGVELFRQSLKDNDRNATGKTSESIAYTVQTTDNKVVLEIRAVGHPSIQNLETGMTAEEVQASRPDFQDIVEWTRARGFGDSAVAGAILGGILNDGWNTELPNRTGVNGGTQGILSDPRDIIVKRITETAAVSIKEDLLNALRGSKK